MSEYYNKVETYYDQDAVDFENRYWKNPVLQRIRQDFREVVKKYSFSSALEIGFGTGLDLAHFAAVFPDCRIAGLDISGAMQRHAAAKLEPYPNAWAHQGSVENIQETAPGTYDLIYVFFGALNTVEDLHKAALHLHAATHPGSKLVLTFVNKWYLGGMAIEVLKGKFGSAFNRLKTVWGGYSPSKQLDSRCYSPKEIKQAFSQFHLIKRQGYSIIHPAWYYHKLNRRLGRMREVLWKMDKSLNRTPLWSCGEYTLFVFQRQ